MAAKKLNIEGYGDIFIQGVDIKDPEGIDCTADGKLVHKETIGERAKTVYKTEDGIEVSSSNICKKFDVNGKEIVVNKFNATKTISKNRIKESNENGVIYRAMDKKIYNVTTDCQALKDKVLKEGKTLEFPITFGNGYKAWRGVLTNWKGKLILFGCRGDIDVALEKYSEETIEIVIEEPSQQEEFMTAMVGI